MANVREQKLEMVEVELKADDVREAVIVAARKAAHDNHLMRGQSIDEKWAAQVVADGYGGFKVYFRINQEARTKTAA